MNFKFALWQCGMCAGLQAQGTCTGTYMVEVHPQPGCQRRPLFTAVLLCLLLLLLLLLLLQFVLGSLLGLLLLLLLLLSHFVII